MEKEQFNFVPISKRRQLQSNGNYIAAISKTGVIRINTIARREIIGDCKFVRVFLDIQQRTIGLQFSSKISPDKSWRKLWFSKERYALISAMNVATAFNIKGQSFSGLPLKEYQDSIYGKVVYFRIPKWQKKDPDTDIVQ